MVYPVKAKFKDLIKNDIEYNDLKLFVNDIEDLLSIIIIEYMYSPNNLAEIPSGKFLPIPNYRSIINYLKEEEILYVNEHYSYTKHFSKSYGFTDNFKSVEHKVEFQLKVSKSLSDVNKLEKSIKERLSNDFKKLKVVCTPKLDIKYKDKKGEEFYDFKKYLKDCLYTFALDAGAIYYHWLGSNLYSNFTEISTFNRDKCLSIDGDKMASKTIKSPLPLFLAKWIKINGNIDDHYEFTEYFENLIKDKFYSNLRNDYEANKNRYKKKDVNFHYSNKNVKVFVNEVLFGDNGQDESNYSFYRRYPLIFDIIKDQDKLLFRNELVELQSDFLFNVVVKRIYSEVDAVIIACEDQIYYSEKYSEQIDKIWEEEMQTLLDSIHALEDEIIIVDDAIEYFKGPAYKRHNKKVQVFEGVFNAKTIEDQNVIKRDTESTIKWDDLGEEIDL